MKGITLIVLIVASAMIGSAVGMAGTDFQSTSTQMSHIGEVIESDTTFNITTRIFIATATDNGAAQGGGSLVSPLAITSATPTQRVTAITKGNYTYEITITEKTSTSANNTDKWRVDLFKDGTQITPSAYINNPSNAGDSSTEGIKLRYDLTKTFSGGVLEVKVTKNPSS
jgi:hypothetical protein